MGGGIDVVVLSTFLEYKYLLRSVKVIIRILQPFSWFFFYEYLFICFFIPLLVFSLLRYSLVVTESALFSKTLKKDENVGPNVYKF